MPTLRKGSPGAHRGRRQRDLPGLSARAQRRWWPEPGWLDRFMRGAAAVGRAFEQADVPH